MIISKYLNRHIRHHVLKSRQIRYTSTTISRRAKPPMANANMLFKTVLFWMSSTFVLGVYVSLCLIEIMSSGSLTDQAAAINDTRTSSSPNTEFMDINALTQTPADVFPSLDTAAHNTNASSVTKRDYNFKTAPYKCHGLDFGYAAVGSVVAGIEHLTSSSLKGKPSNGGLNCGRVSCSDNAAIWWCNNVSPCFSFNFCKLSSIRVG